MTVVTTAALNHHREDHRTRQTTRIRAVRLALLTEMEEEAGVHLQAQSMDLESRRTQTQNVGAEDQILDETAPWLDSRYHWRLTQPRQMPGIGKCLAIFGGLALTGLTE